MDLIFSHHRTGVNNGIIVRNIQTIGSGGQIFGKNWFFGCFLIFFKIWPPKLIFSGPNMCPLHGGGNFWWGKITSLQNFCKKIVKKVHFWPYSEILGRNFFFKIWLPKRYFSGPKMCPLRRRENFGGKKHFGQNFRDTSRVTPVAPAD